MPGCEPRNQIGLTQSRREARAMDGLQNRAMGYMIGRWDGSTAVAVSRCTSTRHRASTGRRTSTWSVRSAARCSSSSATRALLRRCGGTTECAEPDAREALRIVEDNQELFLAEWRRLHGP